MPDGIVRPNDMSALARKVEFIERSRLCVAPDSKPGNTISGGTYLVGPTALLRTATIRSYHIDDAVFETLSLRGAMASTPFARQGLPASEPGCNPQAPGEADAVTIDSTDEIIIGCNASYADPQRWLLQCLPAIDWGCRSVRGRSARVLLPPLERWQEDLIHMLGHADVPRITIDPNKRYRIPHAVYSDFLMEGHGPQVSLAVRDTLSRIGANLPRSQSAHRAVYFRCSDPHYGSISNEAEVVTILRRQGVHIAKPLYPGRMLERLSLFRDADMVIGANGPDLVGAVLSSPGSLLWEWCPAHLRHGFSDWLAWTAGIDYQRDTFPADSEPSGSGWTVDLGVLQSRLSDISTRTRRPTHQADALAKPGPTIIELMLAFESLGDNCEFGLVQRRLGVEPISLLRFAGITRPGKFRVVAMAEALGAGFRGLGKDGSVEVYLDGRDEKQEYSIRESVYRLMSHTFIKESDGDPEQLQASETQRLKFLRLKLVKDLSVGRRIWVWKSIETPDVSDIMPLLAALRRLGPNKLLWVVEATEPAQAGTIEQLDHDFVKGYVEKIAPYQAAYDSDLTSWLLICHQVHALFQHEIAKETTDVSDLVARELQRHQDAASNQAVAETDAR
jgi:hypothetical protein